MAAPNRPEDDRPDLVARWLRTNTDRRCPACRAFLARYTRQYPDGRTQHQLICEPCDREWW
jgi:hypothetical protein